MRTHVILVDVPTDVVDARDYIMSELEDGNFLQTGIQMEVTEATSGIVVEVRLDNDVDDKRFNRVIHESVLFPVSGSLVVEECNVEVRQEQTDLDGLLAKLIEEFNDLEE